jgi:hypothetical protein
MHSHCNGALIGSPGKFDQAEFFNAPLFRRRLVSQLEMTLY